MVSLCSWRISSYMGELERSRSIIELDRNIESYHKRHGRE